MPAASFVVVTGVKELDRALAKLEPAVRRKVVRQAMRKGLKVMADAVKAEAPVDTGTLKDAVKVRAVKQRRRGAIELEVRILADDNTKKTSAETGQTVFYPAVVEYGTAHAPPNPFMRRAYEAKGEAARQATLKAVIEGIEREAEKA
jgi:HK97 gp10 family phage protein